MRRGSYNLEIITFELLANGADGATFVRTGDTSNKSGTDVTWTSLAGLDPGGSFPRSRSTAISSSRPTACLQSGRR
jgi:hypothetical protein